MMINLCFPLWHVPDILFFLSNLLGFLRRPAQQSTRKRSHFCNLHKHLQTHYQRVNNFHVSYILFSLLDIKILDRMRMTHKNILTLVPQFPGLIYTIQGTEYEATKPVDESPLLQIRHVGANMVNSLGMCLWCHIEYTDRQQLV